MTWGICEWFGTPILDMSPDERKASADDALAEKIGDELGRLCPFIQHLEPGAFCNKKGGVCSIMPYGNEAEAPPASVCPRRLVAPSVTGEDIFDLLARECFNVAPHEDYALVKEVPFLLKVDADGQARGAKAGRIDWVLVTDIDQNIPEWLAIETQAVYFSGGAMAPDFKGYQENPGQLNATAKARRPDWRSSGPKRLAPQLDTKSPVMRRWGKKVAVVVDEGFYREFAGFVNDDVDFENSEVVWVVVGYNADMSITIRIERYAELRESIDAINATRPVRKNDFEATLQQHVRNASEKVYIKRLP